MTTHNLIGYLLYTLTPQDNIVKDKDVQAVTLKNGTLIVKWIKSLGGNGRETHKDMLVKPSSCIVFYLEWLNPKAAMTAG